VPAALLELEKVAQVAAVRDCEYYRPGRTVGSGRPDVMGCRYESASCSMLMRTARKCHDECPRAAPEEALAQDLADIDVKLKSAEELVQAHKKRKSQVLANIRRVKKRDMGHGKS
jgi:hypothetical protein